ncbi:hypothetical protein D3C72_1114620 [compost metagenome]
MNVSGDTPRQQRNSGAPSWSSHPLNGTLVRSDHRYPDQDQPDESIAHIEVDPCMQYKYNKGSEPQASPLEQQKPYSYNPSQNHEQADDSKAQQYIDISAMYLGTYIGLTLDASVYRPPDFTSAAPQRGVPDLIHGVTVHQQPSRYCASSSADKPRSSAARRREGHRQARPCAAGGRHCQAVRALGRGRADAAWALGRGWARAAQALEHGWVDAAWALGCGRAAAAQVQLRGRAIAPRGAG